MSDPIKAALDAAERAPTKAAAIAAFLRALPGVSVDIDITPYLRGLADRVERAAQEAGGCISPTPPP